MGFLKFCFWLLFVVSLLYIPAYYATDLVFHRDPATLVLRLPENKVTIPKFVVPGDTVEVILRKVPSISGKVHFKAAHPKFPPIEAKNGEHFTWNPPWIDTPRNDFRPGTTPQELKITTKDPTAISLVFPIPAEPRFNRTTVTVRFLGAVEYPIVGHASRYTIDTANIDSSYTVYVGTVEERNRHETAREVMKLLIYVAGGIVVMGLFYLSVKQ
jgi:hypothetical protein